jgi:hypothetical protein
MQTDAETFQAASLDNVRGAASAVEELDVLRVKSAGEQLLDEEKQGRKADTTRNQQGCFATAGQGKRDSKGPKDTNTVATA